LETTVGYADLIAHKVAALPPEKQAEVLRYVDALAGTASPRVSLSDSDIQTVLERTRGAWGSLGLDEVDAGVAAMRDEWTRDWER
jgi:hypothetical protein